MQIIIKGIKGFEVYPENKDYVRRKFEKYGKLVKEPAIFEFTFEHSHLTRATLDKQVRLTFTMPGLKNPEHLEEIAEHFPEAIDKLESRFEEFIRRFREKELDKRRQQ